MPAIDAFDLRRFVEAQSGVHERAVAELRSGRKRSNWMWYVFPQLRGLGHSATSVRYGITGIDEGRAHLAQAAEPGPVFERLLDKYFGDERDSHTVAMLLLQARN